MVSVTRPRVSETDIAEIGSLLLDVSEAGERIARVSIGREPPANSFFGQLMGDPLNSQPTWRGGDPVRAGYQDALTADMAGLDHVWAFVVALKAGGAVALATLTRGGVEVFARAAWLLSSKSAGELIQRQAAVTLDDLKYIRKWPDHSRLFQGQGDKRIDPVDYEESVTRSLTSLGLTKVEKPSVTTLTSDFLAELLKAKGRTLYSELSAVSHGESYAINSYLCVKSVDFDGQTTSTISLAPPRDSVIEYAMDLTEASVDVQEMITERCKPPNNEINRWAIARDRSESRIQKLANSRNP